MAARPTLDQLVEELSRPPGPAGPDLDRLAKLLLPASGATAAGETAGARRTTATNRPTADDLASWRALLRDVPFDRRSFDDRFRPGSWTAVLDGLARHCDRLADGAAALPVPRRQTVGFLALMLITLTGLAESSDRRTATGPARAGTADGDAPPPGHDCPGVCRRLVRQRPVRETIRELYRPAGGPLPDQDGQDAVASSEWAHGIDFDTLEFHEHGTTSVILRGSGTRRGGLRRPFALKLILYPYLRIPRIASTTRAYAGLYDLAGVQAEHLVAVWASSHSWILMDFVAGRGLHEVWRERTARRRTARRARPGRRATPGDDQGLGEASVDRFVLLADLRDYGTAAFLALAELDRFLNADNHPAEPTRRGHGDLAPSNIIVTYRDGRPVFRLIDIGANYLYTYAFGALEGPDGQFVAPEVKTDGAAGDKSDVYSLGKLLTMFGGGEPGDVVPDEFYAHAPLLARFIEDLIDTHPDHRLLLFSPDAAPTGQHAASDQEQRPAPEISRYARLHAAFTAELDAEAARTPPTDGHLVRGTWELFQTRLTLGLFRPLAGAPGQLRRIYRTRRGEPGAASRSSALAAARLLAWSWLSSVAWAVTFSITLIWIVRQLDWSWGNRLVEALQQVVGGSEDRFPFLDSLRAPGYSMPDIEANAPALLVGLTYAMVSAKYYHNIFAGMNPLAAGWRAGGLTIRAALAQFAIRIQTVTGAALVLPIVLYDPRLWPINSAIGQTLSLFTNSATLLFARRALTDARRRGLSTVPSSDAKVTGLASFAEWTPTSLFYAGIVWTIGLAVYQGALQDVYVYALSVASINLFLFYMIKCGRGAAEVRTALTRATGAAERLRCLALARRDDHRA
ncbi:hypothetical protein [Solwaraspora sp. WMMD792]|uniref:hypothetical protein n=1 Tax=Solwaraspora sp. WMMD792 TaxID=3016099 RepID=UPI0024168D5E|nr:hypothetical protein [Solwaraspora sp. WMMD792]MDG4770231.1 hypothetical protein [Solwaraspora sp. WMMD792]